MRYLSVCSGIEAASVAWHPLGWEPVGFAEIEPFPRAVLAHHYPRVPNHGDMNAFKDWPDAAIDLLVGGTPCQSFSVAGLRKGLADPRGNLALVYLAIADRYRPEWIVWENVPGVLSSSGGRDFGAFIGGLEQLGYHAGWRVLDAQYVRVDGFGRAVPQRRRRVFVVGHLGDWRRAAAVLFERESLQGHSAPRRQTGEGIAPTISARPTGGGGLGTDFDLDGGLIPELSHCLNAGGMGRQDYETGTVIACATADTLSVGANQTMGFAGEVVAHALRADGFDASEDGTGRGTPLIAVSDTLVSNGDAHSGFRDEKGLVAFSITPSNSNADYNARETQKSQAITGSGNRPSARGGDLIASGWAVRRLTPLECERLQGFPDGYTVVPYRGKPAADGPRYKALGNSMAVNAMRWLGRRIETTLHIHEGTK